MDIVGRNIRELRKSRGLLQKELAARAGMNASNLSKLEQGDYTWTKDNLGRLAAALGVDLAVLFAGEPRIPLLGHAKEGLEEGIAPGGNWRVLNAIDDKLDRILSAVSEVFSRGEAASRLDSERASSPTRQVMSPKAD